MLPRQYIQGAAMAAAGSFGTSIATTLWDRRASLQHAQLADHVTHFDPSTFKRSPTCKPAE